MLENIEKFKVINIYETACTRYSEIENRSSHALVLKNIFSVDLNVSKIVNRSEISGTYFRNIFVGIYGTTPKKYIINKRLIQARQLIDSGDFTGIKEVAESVGFGDALYFGKIFKQKYGCAPQDYAKGLR